ncbi:unnamed protein product [Prorocentrum cordatum]|uniref:Uncharacterized protein n=1 Tax=Prorocentrum cordatum TaxID=2364126 RepID=A0ABN9SCX2_9DINO|nr:unnamed protein product [Polarella glacialis]
MAQGPPAPPARPWLGESGASLSRGRPGSQVDQIARAIEPTRRVHRAMDRPGGEGGGPARQRLRLPGEWWEGVRGPAPTGKTEKKKPITCCFWGACRAAGGGGL